jgi:hypothetical protein
MKFEIPREEAAPPDLHKVFIRHLQEGDLGSIYDALSELLVITGERPLAILAQVKRREPPQKHRPMR